MAAKLVRLDDLLKIMVALDLEQFVENYPGHYLLAMGFVSAENIRVSLVDGNRRGGGERTTPIKVAREVKHDVSQPHPLAGHVFRIQPDSSLPRLILGRRSSCEIHVPDASVSEAHLRVEVLERELIVEDLGSKNGTSINLKRVPPGQAERLGDGDLLTVGRYSFQLLSAFSLYAQLALIRDE
jgi:hypothetical protein